MDASLSVLSTGINTSQSFLKSHQSICVGSFFRKETFPVFFFFFLGSTGVLNSGLGTALARQALYHFALIIFEIGALFLPRPAWISVLLF
jgi:hypothetical protein